MNQREIEAYLTEFEQRFRARTPSNDILDVLPEYRVGRSEMRTWFAETFGRDIVIDDAIQLNKPLETLFKVLRKEFPNERWS